MWMSVQLKIVCVYSSITDKTKVGEEVKGVGVMKDEELKFEEIEVSHTLGGYRRCTYYSVVRYTIVNRSRRICRQGKGLVVKKPMDLCGRESEDHDHGVGSGVNVIIMSDVLY